MWEMFSIFFMLSKLTPCSPIGSGRIPQFVELCQVRYHIGDLEVSLTHQQYYNHNLAVLQFVS